MKVWVDKRSLAWLEEMQNEGRTREITISTFKRFTEDNEIEVELNK